MTGLRVVKTGLLATVQDLGRIGYLGHGVTTGGALDAFSLRCANRLLGNADNLAGIEIALTGLTLMATCNLQLALCGAPATLLINGEQQFMDQALYVPSGSTITIGRTLTSTYSYLAVKGGISTPPVLGSRSTVVREGIGGLDGQALKAGDLLPVADLIDPTTGSAPKHLWRRQLHGKTDPQNGILRLRFVPGLHYDDVTQNCRDTLCAQSFTISGAANRMAVPLNGNPIDTGLTKLWSEATCLGSIQIPPDGQPLVLLNDRQTMGGYPQLGVIISLDRVRLGQARAGQQVQLEAMTLAAAEQVVWLHEHYEETHLKALDRLGGTAP
ncbi:MAG: biotin-dependent carboxyltransferase family protein [Luminiphilus sp.]|nr:biotin-dependent carboxyltransferase family protein [Luminiphilus sp.]